MKLRNGILQITAASIYLEEKKEKLHFAVSSQECRRTIEDYPIAQVKLSDGIMLKLIKSRRINILYGYMNIQRYLLGVRKAIRKIKND